MAYESFTLKRLETAFGLHIAQSEDDYGAIAPVAPGAFLQTAVARGRRLVVGKTSEKARSEFLVAPVLMEVCEARDRQISLFSGVKFDVDKSAGLFGYCDFLVARDPLVDAIRAPVLFVTEAKKEDLNAGVPQCIAEMVAAHRFNEREGTPIATVYGAVTDGTRWRFLRLESPAVTIDLREYSLPELSQIVGILVYMTL